MAQEKVNYEWPGDCPKCGLEKQREQDEFCKYCLEEMQPDDPYSPIPDLEKEWFSGGGR